MQIKGDKLLKAKFGCKVNVVTNFDRFVTIPIHYQNNYFQPPWGKKCKKKVENIWWFVCLKPNR